MKYLIIFVLIALAAWQGYSLYNLRLETVAVLESVADTVQPIAQVPVVNTARPTLQASSQYKCDGRTHCSHMTSCAEAKYFLQNCPGVKMDGDHDGIPCEKQWCN